MPSEGGRHRHIIAVSNSIRPRGEWKTSTFGRSAATGLCSAQVGITKNPADKR